MEEIRAGDIVRTGVYVLGEWRPMMIGEVISVSDDGTLAEVDVMSLHGGAPWVHLEQISHLRKEPPNAKDQADAA